MLLRVSLQFSIMAGVFGGTSLTPDMPMCLPDERQLQDAGAERAASLSD